MRVAVTDRDPANVAGDVVVWVFRPGDRDVPFPFARHLSRRALGLVQTEEHALTWLEATRMLAPRALMASLGGDRPKPGLGGFCGDKTAEEIVVRDRHDLRTLGAEIERACNAAGAKRLVLVVEPGGAAVELLVEGMLLRAYQCNEWRDREAASSVRQVTVCVAKSEKRDAKTRVRRAETIAQATNFTRELGDLPSNIGTPMGIVERVRPHAQAAGLAMRVMSMGEAREHGLGLFCGVAAGSVNPGCILELEHDPGAARPRPLLILIGKGVTHDIGGYNIKTGPNVHAMTYDKCGGMAVIGAMMAIANLKLPLRVIAIVPLAENAIDGHPFKPGDILTAMDTTTVFIENTDAEGRLVLADALCWADHYEPDAVIDLATLTGAGPMGDPFGALFSNSDELRDLLLESGRSTDDLLWSMPIHEQHERELTHFKADVRNVGPGIGGAGIAAAFLRYFVEFPWAHVDILGKEFWEFPRDYRGEGATGFGCRLLVEAATRFAAAHGDPSREVRDGT